MWRHIQDLCQTFDIEIVPCERPEDSRGGLVHGKLYNQVRVPGQPATQKVIMGRMIQVKKVTNAFLYAIALHEVGHILHPNGLSTETRNAMDEELAAWQWAEHHALDWTADMQAAKDYGLMTHTVAEQQREMLAQGLLTPPPAPVVQVDPDAARKSEQDYREKGRDVLRRIKL